MPTSPGTTSSVNQEELRQPVHEEPRRSGAEIRGEALRLNNRISLFREFEERAEILLNQSKVRINDLEDIHRVVDIFIDDDWDNKKLRRMVSSLSNPRSKTSREFIKEFLQFRDEPSN